MKIKIEISTAWNAYSCFCWTKEQEDNASDELKDLVQRFKQTSGTEQDGIANEITEWGEDHIDPEPSFGSIYVTYPDGEHEDEVINRPEEVENDHGQWIEKKIEDPSNRLVIYKITQWKRGGFVATVETKQPFNINFLSVANGEISYGMHTLENTGDGEANFTEFFYS
jgi:hypothetical protein|tara:strand:- start:81 stop:584 length:504 start_codon:yes stop_codon:yes gene_type:complete